MTPHYPMNWKTSLLDDVCVRGSGHTPSKKHPEYWDGGIKWVSLADCDSLDRVFIADTKKNISERGLQNSSARMHAKGTVVLSRDAGVGKSAILADDMAVSQHFIAWECSSKGIIDHKFLYQWLQHNKRRFEIVACGSTIPTIGVPYFSCLEISYPPIEQQRAISELLTELDCICLATEQLIRVKQRRLQALAQRLLTGKARLSGFATPWQTSKIGQLLKPVRRPVTWDDSAEYKLLSLRRRSGGAFHRETLLGSEILTKKMNVARAGDFLISKMQVVHGAMAMVPQEFDGFHVSDSYLAYTARSQEQLDMRFFDWLSRLPIMYRKAYISSYGVHIEKMTFNDGLFLGEKVTLPPTVEEQRAIVEVLEDADREIALHRAELDALKRQKRGLMQQLLTGKVRVP